MAEAQPTDRDLLLLLKVEHVEQGLRRVEGEVQNLGPLLVPLLQKIIAHLAAQQSPPAPPVAQFGQIYPALDETAEDADEALPAEASLPPQPGGWRRLFPTRATKVLAIGALVVVCALPWYRLNFTASAPRGVWAIHRLSPVIHRGQWVTLHAPRSVAPWVSGFTPLLKPVAAVAGERVCVQEATLWIRGQSYGRVYQHAPHGEPLPHLGEGCRIVPPGQVFLASPAAKSLDSRYFGAVPVAALTAQATPVVVWR